DPRGRYELLDLIVTLKQRHELTIIYISSSLQDVIDLADTIHILEQGRLAFSGTPREILARASELTKLDIEMPEAAQIALSLRDIMPDIRTNVLNLEELEEEITKHISASSTDENREIKAQ
ncbi:MAG: hypothetical protein JOZ18_23585, partial [Chloroflexi bacterium]|nr:hypothetical protein [Chloroflexota bacterium]